MGKRSVPKRPQVLEPTKPVQAPDVRNFLIVGVKGNPNGVKVFVESLDVGKNLLNFIYVAISEKKPYINADRGLLFNGTEVTHAFLTLERIQQ